MTFSTHCLAIYIYGIVHVYGAVEVHSPVEILFLAPV
jgi:hypothetical protein